MARREAPSSTYTYEQMMERKAELLEQSPWLADYEIEAFLSEEGYNVYEQAPEGYVPPNAEEDSGIEYFYGNESDTSAEAGVSAAETEPSPEAAAEPEKPAVQPAQQILQERQEKKQESKKPEVTDSAKLEQDKKTREVRTRARNLLKKNIAQETGRMGMALLSFIVLQIAICGLLTAYLMIIAGYKEVELNRFLSDPMNMLVLQGVLLIAGLGLPFVLYIYVLNIPVREAVPFKKVPLGDLMRMTFIGLGFAGTVTYVENAIVNKTVMIGGFANDQIVLAESKGAGLVLSIFCLCILPAILEEFVFRGVILQVLRRRGGDTFAIVMSAIMCALIYSNYKGIGGMIISVLLGYLVVFSGSLLPGMVIILMRNMLNLVVTLLGTRINPTEVTYIDMGITILFILLAVMCMPGMFKRYPDFFKIKQDKSSLTLGEKLRVGLTRPSMLILIIYAAFFTVLEFIPTDRLFERFLK